MSTVVDEAEHTIDARFFNEQAQLLHEGRDQTVLKELPRWVFVMFGVALLAAAGTVAYYVSAKKSAQSQTLAKGASDGSHPVTPEQFAALAGQLEEKLKKSPEDLSGWLMLARTHIARGRFDDAAQAYAQAARLKPQDADLLADYADALGMARGRKLAGDPLDIARRALEIDPRHAKALALAGSAEFEAQRYAAAIEYWERALARVGTESDLGRSIQRGIHAARERGNLFAASAATPAGTAKSTAAKAAAPKESAAAAPHEKAAAAEINGTVRLSSALKAKVSPGDAVFVFARAVEGPRTPLAILRLTVADLPYALKLDDSQASNPQTRLSAQKQVVLVARVSRSGNAMGKPGDLEGTSAPLSPGARGVEIVIDRVLTVGSPKGHG